MGYSLITSYSTKTSFNGMLQLLHVRMQYDPSEILGNSPGTATSTYVTLCDTHLCTSHHRSLWSQLTVLTGQSKVVLTSSLTREIEMVLQKSQQALVVMPAKFCLENSEKLVYKEL